MRWIKRIILFVILLLGLLALAVSLMPWKRTAESKLRAAIEAQGLAPAAFTLHTLAPGEIVVTQATLGDPAVSFSRLTLYFSTREMLAVLRAGGDLLQVVLRGHWRIEGLAYPLESFPLPPMAGQGDWALDGGRFTLSGALTEDKKTHEARFSLAYPLATPNEAALKVETARMPWGGGEVTLTNASVPLAGNAPITVKLGVRNVALSAVLKALAGDLSTATGVVNGAIPVTYHTKDGTVSLGNGTLKTDAPGVITLAPEAIPGDNAQVALVREIMKNLHYTTLSLALAPGENRSLSATLAVEGKNPDAAGGRPIKLQVNLSGDLLSLFSENLQLMNDPTQFIEKNSHETTPD